VSRRVALAGGVLCLLLAGCAGGEGEAETTTSPITPAPAMNEVRVYFLREGKVWPARREVSADVAQANATLDELIAGPTAQEETELGWTTALPDGIKSYSILGTPGQRGAVSLEIEAPLTRAARAQIVYTLTQFPLVEAVVLKDQTYQRSDFERHTPSVLVESPLAFDEVANPVHAFGTASAFEAAFNYELTDTDGRIVDEDIVTATSGPTTRGLFEFVTDEYEIPFDGMGSLIVFELSAADGSRTNLVEIPVRMSK
jgi:hypothetical protein